MTDSFSNRVIDTWVGKKQESTVDQFAKPREDGEIDLIASCRQLLVDSGLIQNAESSFDTSQHIKIAQGANSLAQRYCLNTFWRIQLMRLPCDTQRERFCLLDEGPVENWLRIFEEAIMPVVRLHNLPKSI